MSYQLSDSSILLLCILLETEIIMKENLLYGIINILCPKNNLEFAGIIMNQILRKLFEDQSFYDSCFYIETAYLSKDMKSFFSFFNWNSIHARLDSHYELQEKRSTKRLLKNKGNQFS